MFRLFTRHYSLWKRNVFRILIICRMCGIKKIKTDVKQLLSCICKCIPNGYYIPHVSERPQRGVLVYMFLCCLLCMCQLWQSLCLKMKSCVKQFSSKWLYFHSYDTKNSCLTEHKCIKSGRKNVSCRWY